jgi:integrase
MKYNVLLAFREHLRGVFANSNTADRYCFVVSKTFGSLQFDELSEIPREYTEQKLLSARTKRDFSALKRGLEVLKTFDGGLDLPSEEFMRDTAKTKRNRSFRPPKVLELDRIDRKVNAIRNEKLKLAYRLMEKSGLRVSETAQLQKRDITVKNGAITVAVKHGKGGSNGFVECLEDKCLAEQLEKYLQNMDDSEHPFCSANTMKHKAGKLNLECHNFRRIAAITYRNEQCKHKSLDEANDDTQRFLRHTRFSVTKRYLQNRKLKFIGKCRKC